MPDVPRASNRNSNEPPGPPRIKICGLTRHADARAAAEAGADFLGVVVVASSPRAVEAARAREIRGGLDVPLVLVSADRGAEALAADARHAGADVLQLHGAETPDDLRRLREAGDWILWKAVRVRSGGDLAEALARYAGSADGLLLDAWHPEKLGGTGRTFDWDEVRTSRARIPAGTTLVAAGGLTPDNVGEAIRALRPDVVDVSSGVESSPAVKDPERIRAFVRAAREAGAEPRDADTEPPEADAGSQESDSGPQDPEGRTADNSTDAEEARR